MKEEKTAVKNPAGKENEPMNENATKKKTKEERPPTKVVIRRLPPSMTEEQFKVQVSPMPDHDYFYFVPADMTLMPNAFARAYINFLDQNDLFIFTQKFDGYVFVDSKGGEFPAVVEFAPFQRIPKNRPGRKKDSKMGTIETDPKFIAFKERLEAENFEKKAAANASKQHFFETSLAPDKKEEISNTPLLEFIRNKRAERQRIREEKREEKRKKDLERRRAKEEQRRIKKDDDGSVMKTPPPSPPVNPTVNLSETPSNSSEVKADSENEKHQCETGATELPLSRSPATKTNDQDILPKVRHLVNFFSKPTSDAGNSNTDNHTNVSTPVCIEHTDLEKEMLKILDDFKEVKSKTTDSNVITSKNFNTVNVPSSGRNFNDSKIMSTKYKPIPVLESRDRVPPFMSRSNSQVMYSRTSNHIVMRPIRTNPPGQRHESFLRKHEVMRPVRYAIPVIQSCRKDFVGGFNQNKKIFEGRTPVRVSVPLSLSSRKECENSLHHQNVKNNFEGKGPITTATSNQPKNKVYEVNNSQNVSVMTPLRIVSSQNQINKKENEVCNDQKIKVNTPTPILTPQNQIKNNECDVSVAQKVRVMARVKIASPHNECEVSDSQNVFRSGLDSTDSLKKSLSKTSSLDILKKNLQKVVKDVLGNTKVKSPRENVNKPKTFIRRSITGNGDECSKPGFNTPNFYLPPRAFGCGPSESASKNKEDVEKSRRVKSSERLEKGQFSLPMPNKSLPPFSKKSASSSKSDGDIEKIDSQPKAGGSEERIKKVPRAYEVRVQLCRRPYVAPRKLTTMEKTKISSK